ncbi:MAG: protein translocase subunit SecD [Planctomycetaceae bacterium]|nr:protein translocase subunit SecD [Planctomycetaceae bacterium]
MDKNLTWKIVLILLVVVGCSIYVWPPQEKLKQGLDLAGGTSLIYEIDATDLSPREQKDLAQNMIPILLKRIDPTHVANLVMRPQGDTRIEIQLPVASADTRKKRDALQESIDALEQENINLLKIRQALALPADQRQAEFEKFAGSNEQRRQILDQLAAVYDQRTDLQKQRDTLTAEMTKISEQLTQMGLDPDALASSVSQWSTQDPQQRISEIESYLKTNLPVVAPDTQKNAVALINRSLDLRKERAPVVEKLAEPDNGLNVQWNKAIKDLSRLNLDIDSFKSVLDLPAGSPSRKSKLEAFKNDFPDRDAKIDKAVGAFDDYRVVGGRLDDPEDLKRMLKGSGVLEFRILPTGEELSVEQAQAYREQLIAKGPKAASDSRYLWMPVEDTETPIGGITGQFGEKVYVLCSNLPNETMLQRGDKKWTLKKAYPTTDEQGRRAIGFTFDTVAANKFFAITSNNIGKPLCILLDDVAISAPNINSAIHSSGIIMGTYTPTQVMDMVNKLNAGSFPARLSEVPISEKSISATIGADNRDQAIRAGIIGMIAVAAFLLVYYRLSGIITVIALILNLVILLAAMVLLDATFTLPGIAGLILTFGMSDDANVLINERIREEQKRGSSVKAAIANGYSRAFTTIFDSNITTFGVAAILYMVASEEIKGFAIVLMLGIAISMFTGLFVTRVMMDFMTSRGLVTRPLSMFGIFQNVNINWMKLRPVFFTISAIMVIGGLSVFFFRDQAKTGSKYDIEFIGGTSVEIELKQGSQFSDRAAVEQRINKYLGNARVYEVGKTGNRFEITTTLTNNTTADLKFASPAGHTVQSVTDAIVKSGEETGKALANLNVIDKGDGSFQVTTTRVNAGLVEEVLTGAFGEAATVSNIQVREIVSDAVRDAFHEYLSIKENLGITFDKEERIEMGSEDAGLLSDYLGGLKISASLNRPATLKDLNERISSLRYRADLQGVKWYRYAILKPDLTQPGEEEPLKSFVYVSAHPEAGYRDLETHEWQTFAANENTKLQEAASLETSLAKITQIDPSIGEQAKQKAIVAIILSLLAIVAYIWVRFGTARYGLAAIASLVHDVSITLGLVAGSVYIAGTPLGKMLGIQDFKISMEMVAAFLTIIGYSLNDTIVVFDRIRENRGRLSVVTPEMITTSINQTLSRTILTSFTTWLAVFVMYVWGGEGMRGFNFAMTVGILIGTYSSIAIAAPILLVGSSGKIEQVTPAKKASRV